MAKKSAKPKQTVSFEESLWDSANKLRGSVESSEYGLFTGLRIGSITDLKLKHFTKPPLFRKLAGNDWT